MLRTTLSCALLLLAGCDGTADPDGGTGADAPPRDTAGFDVPSTDAPGTDAPGLDAPGTDGGGTTCGLPVAFDVGLSPTRTLYVAVGGSGDGSAASPFGSIETAIRAATPGTLVLVRAGTYAGDLYIENVNGTASAPIWLRGEDGAILDAAGAGEVLHVTEASYLVIEGLELRGSSTANGLNIDDGGSDRHAHPPRGAARSLRARRRHRRQQRLHQALGDRRLRSCSTRASPDCRRRRRASITWAATACLIHGNTLRPSSRAAASR
jgi:hypothetical protein